MNIFDFAIMGTSLSSGAGRPTSYVHDLVPSMEEGKEGRVRVYNFSKDGAQSSQGLIEYPKACALKPKAILIEYQMNDCTISYSTSQSRTLEIINGIKSLSPFTLIYLMTMNPVFTAGGSDAVARASVATYYQMYRDLAVSEEVGLIDCNLAYAGATIADVPDGVHASVAAERLYTVPTIKSALTGLFD